MAEITAIRPFASLWRDRDLKRIGRAVDAWRFDYGLSYSRVVAKIEQLTGASRVEIEEVFAEIEAQEGRHA